MNIYNFDNILEHDDVGLHFFLFNTLQIPYSIYVPANQEPLKMPSHVSLMIELK